MYKTAFTHSSSFCFYSFPCSTGWLLKADPGYKKVQSSLHLSFGQREKKSKNFNRVIFGFVLWSSSIKLTERCSLAWYENGVKIGSQVSESVFRTSQGETRRLRKEMEPLRPKCQLRTAPGHWGRKSNITQRVLLTEAILSRGWASELRNVTNTFWALQGVHPHFPLSVSILIWTQTQAEAVIILKSRKQLITNPHVLWIRGATTSFHMAPALSCWQEEGSPRGCSAQSRELGHQLQHQGLTRVVSGCNLRVLKRGQECQIVAWETPRNWT